MASSDKKKFGYNPKPKFSANQLAEYIIATPARCKSILKEAKFPGTVMIARYRTAKKALQKHLVDKTRSHHHFTESIVDLLARQKQKDVTKWTFSDSKLSIEAITNFQKNVNKFGFSGFNFMPIKSKHGPLDYDGVKVSVGLDLIAQRTDRNGQKHIGGVIFVFSKGDAAKKNRETRCQTAALLALELSEQFLTALGNIDPEMCMVIDVFNGKLHKGTGSRKALMRDIKAACDDAKQLWPAITPPTGYDGPKPD